MRLRVAFAAHPTSFDAESRSGRHCISLETETRGGMAKVAAYSGAWRFKDPMVDRAVYPAIHFWETCTASPPLSPGSWLELLGNILAATHTHTLITLASLYCCSAPLALHHCCSASGHPSLPYPGRSQLAATSTLTSLLDHFSTLSTRHLTQHRTLRTALSASLNSHSAIPPTRSKHTSIRRQREFLNLPPSTRSPTLLHLTPSNHRHPLLWACSQCPDGRLELCPPPPPPSPPRSSLPHHPSTSSSPPPSAHPPSPARQATTPSPPTPPPTPMTSTQTIAAPGHHGSAAHPLRASTRSSSPPPSSRPACSSSCSSGTPSRQRYTPLSQSPSASSAGRWAAGHAPSPASCSANRICTATACRS